MKSNYREGRRRQHRKHKARTRWNWMRQRLGLPCNGRPLNLGEVVKVLHESLEQRHKRTVSRVAQVATIRSADNPIMVDAFVWKPWPHEPCEPITGRWSTLGP